MSSITVNYRDAKDLDIIVEQITDAIRHQMERRTYLAANELRNASLDVLRGQRNGRRYRVPGTKVYYTASAPGEPPAVRTGMFRLSWRPNTRINGDTFVSSVESNIQVGTKRKYLLGELLEEGTKRMAPRPYQDKILDAAERGIVRIYSEPYF